MVTIAHISDPHVGSPYFVPNLMNRVISELNELAPDVVVCTGDLTNEGVGDLRVNQHRGSLFAARPGAATRDAGPRRTCPPSRRAAAW